MNSKERVEAVIIDRKTKRVLIIRKSNVRTKRLEWRLVKGGLEKGESKISALKREIFEELGLKNFSIDKKIYEYNYIDPRYGKRHVSCYLVYSDENKKLNLSKEENIKEFKWVKPEEAIKILKFKEEKEAVKSSMLTSFL